MLESTTKSSKTDLSVDLVDKPLDMAASEDTETVLTDRTHMVAMEATITHLLRTALF